MKKILNLTKRILILSVFTLISNTLLPCKGGKIVVNHVSPCVGVFLKVKLTGHTVGTNVTYLWQRSNDGGLSWSPTAFTTDTANISTSTARLYRCFIDSAGVCSAYSDTFSTSIQPRRIDYVNTSCWPTTEIELEVNPINPAPTYPDTALVKNYRWQYALKGTNLWQKFEDSSGDNKAYLPYDNLEDLDIRVVPYFCFFPGWTHSNFTVSRATITPSEIGIQISNRDCVNDTAELSVTSTIFEDDVFEYEWYQSNSYNGPYTSMGLLGNSIKVKVPSINKFYRVEILPCAIGDPSITSKVYSFIVKQGNFTASLTNCENNEVSIEYANRDSLRNSLYTYWTRSINDSINHTAFTLPVDSQVYKFELLNKTKHYYKIYSKFCPTSTNILDSSRNILIHLNIDSGQLKGSFQACTNDSVYLKLLNYKDTSTFPLFKKWSIKPQGGFRFTDYNSSPQTDSTITFRMKNGWNEYKRTISLCPFNYSKEFSSTIAKTFLPDQPSYLANCTGNMSLNVLNDTVKIVDYTGTIPRSNSTFAYQWIRSTNKVTASIIAGANTANLTITQADRGAFFKRLTRICSANTFSDTTNWSNTTVAAPTAQNGRAIVVDQICLNEKVSICLDNFTPLTTDTPTFVWQYSPDDINWSNMNTSNSNDTCITTIVGADFQYFRRLTFWCPSGRVDSSVSTPVIYIKNLPWFESFTAQQQFGKEIYFNCWRGSNPVCGTYNPTYPGGKIWSEASGGKSGKHMSNWGPTPPTVDTIATDVNKTPPGRRNDLKLITPAFDLKRGKYYRFSFWNREDASNLCWDSLYVTWGTKPTPCDMTNKFGETLTKFSFDQWNKFWSDFTPPDDGIYYFAINIRDKDQTTGEIKIDEVGLAEVQSCAGKSPVKGNTFAPSKIIDRSEEPSLANSYDKSRVTHQYCLHDTIMLTYQEGNYATNFDYHGMEYQFWKKRSDQDWKIEDTFFKPVIGDTLCHVTNRSNYHVMNVVVTDTHTWYKIVATCTYDGKEFHADSLLVNGTHSVPYCEDWEGNGNANESNPAVSGQSTAVLKAGNTGQIIGRVPSFSFCPTCWAAFPQPNENQPPLPGPQPTAADLSFCSATLPFRNPPPGPPQAPQLSPDAGYNGNDVVMNTDARTSVPTTRKILVMPAMRLYKGRGYRVSFRWSDNRTPTQNPWGNVNQDLDSLYLVATKGNRSGRTKDSFSRSKMVPKSLYLNLQSNILENGPSKYRTYWADFSPTDTGTYYFGVVVVAGAANGVAYRFVMDYFCVDTISIDNPDCSEQPKFRDPLRVRVNPDGKIWIPGDTLIVPSGVQWCVGNRVNLELDFGISVDNAWKYGWKYYWQRTTKDYRDSPAYGNSRDTSIKWFTIDSTNGINYLLTNKFQDYRLILANSCKTKFDTVGPFKIGPYRGTESCVVGTRETFLNEQFGFAAVLPQCWDVYPTCRVKILDDGGVGNEFRQMAKLHKNYLDMDFISPATGTCPMPTVQTAVPPGYGATGGVTYRFSFWYKDNGISVPIDSIVAGYSFLRPTDVFQFRLVNKVNNDVVKNSRTNKWRYYTTEVTSSVDTAFHFKIKTYNLQNKRIYRTMFDDILFKPKQNIDALVIAIDSPEYACDLKANSTVKVTVMNIGTSTLTNLPIKIQAGTATPTSDTVTGTLVPNETRTVYVPNVDLSAVGINDIKAWTEAPGEQFTCDDTFFTKIIHLEMPAKPTDTVDTVCVCTPHTMTAPYNNARWYRNATDFTPLYNGGSFTMDSTCRDTNIYYSQWNGAVDYTYPPNFSYGAPTYSAASGGIAFDNISKDTLLIDSVMVYANTLSPSSTMTITLTQYQGAQQVTRNNVSVAGITKLGRQWIPIKIKIPPGTDYKLIYGGGASLAQLPGFIFLQAGSITMDVQFYGDEGYPNAPNAYKYFFNWKLIKLGCESERVKKNLITVPSPKFQLKDTSRVCSQPVFQFCGPMPPSGGYYKYQWASSLPNDTNQCKGATATGWYKLTVTNEFGCVENDSTEVIVDPSPIFSLGTDTSFCKFTPYTLSTGLDSVDNVVTWSDNQAGVNIKILNPGTYVATAYNTQNFCTAKDTINVIRYDLPVFSLGNDRVFCGTSADLQALAPNLPANFNYTWSPPAPTITSTGTYWVEGYDPVTKCKTRDSILANMQPNPVFNLGNDTLACGSVYTINTAPMGNYYYKWSTTATSRSLAVSAPGTYYLTVTDKTYGCEAIDSIKIGFKSVPTFDLGQDIVICATSQLINGPVAPTGDKYDYKWKKPGGSYTVGGASLIVDASGVYYLNVSNNCYNFTDSIRITLKIPPTDAIDMLKDTVGCKKANLQATSSTNYTNLVWKGPIGSSVTGSNANAILADKTGTYSVSLTNECGTASKAAYIRIDDLPIANFTVGYLDSINDCMSILLTNNSVNAITYQWSFGDGKTSTIENPLHLYDQEGSFLVTLKAYNSCGFSSKTVAIKKRDKKCSTVGINSADFKASDIYIYPNPAKDYTQLLGVGLPNGKYRLSIKNLLGQTVFENEIKVIGNEVNEKLEISKFANGEYLIELSNDSESIVRKLQVIK